MNRVVRVVAFAALVSMFLSAPALTEAQGIGVGVKGGFLHSSFDATEAFDSGQGWQAGLFFGGNRPGTIGFMGEFNVLTKKSDSAAGESPLYYFQVPALLRIDIGSSGTGLSDAVVYGIAGPSLDLLFKDELAITTDEVERVDVSIVAGIGFEISRFIIEGRGTWGFRNIAKETNARDVRSTTFAILDGIRFN
jgi:hypothetical protein